MTNSRASDAQAKALAALWSDRWSADGKAYDTGANPTTTAMIRKGLLEPTGTMKKLPRGEYPEYRISNAGIVALANYFAFLAEKIEKDGEA
jgi:hypothetical protein